LLLLIEVFIIFDKCNIKKCDVNDKLTNMRKKYNFK
jgi:hypothetical protein